MATAEQTQQRNSPIDYANKGLGTVQNVRNAQKIVSAVQKAKKVQAAATFIAATWEAWLIGIVIAVIVILFLVIITTIMGSSNGITPPTPSPAPGPPPAQIPNEVVYCQGREKWSSQAYNDGNIAKTGCVPTSMAMVLSSYGGTTYDPGQIATMFHNNGWDYGPGSGQKGTNPWRITSAWLNSMGFQRAQADVVNSSKSPTYLNTKQLQLIKNYADAGWLLLAAVDGYNLPTRVNGPHEVVIEDFDRKRTSSPSGTPTPPIADLENPSVLMFPILNGI